MASAALPEDRVSYARGGELSPNPVNESSLDFRAGVQRSQHNDRGNRGAGKLGGHITGNAGKSQHVDVECLPGCAHRFEILTAVVPQTELQAFSGYGLLDDVGVSVSWLRIAVRIKSVRFE